MDVRLELCILLHLHIYEETQYLSLVALVYQSSHPLGSSRVVVASRPLHCLAKSVCLVVLFYLQPVKKHLVYANAIAK